MIILKNKSDDSTDTKLSHEDNLLSSPFGNYNKNKKIPLYKYFHLKDTKKYDNILISDWDFDPRVIKKLQNKDCNTIGELLGYTIYDLTNWSNFGNISIQRIMKHLEQYFASDIKNDKEFQLDNKNLNKSAFFNYIIEKINKLPEDIQNKKLHPFMFVYNLKAKVFSASLINKLPKQLTIAEFPKYVMHNPIKYINESTKDFVNWLDFDLKSIMQKILNPVLKAQKNTSDIIRERLENKTLDDIGKSLKITRQRVQQIEKKAVAFFFNKYKKQSHDIGMLLYALNDEEQFIRYKNAETYLGDELARTFFFFVSKIRSYNNLFYFDTENNMIVFNFSDAPVKINEKDFFKKLPNLVHEDKLKDSISILAKESHYPADLLLIKAKKLYRHTGKFLHKYVLTSGVMYDYILKEYFKDGFKIADKTEYNRFRNYVEDLFSYRGIVTSRSVDAVISRIGVLCGRGKYIHPDYVNVDKSILEHVYNFIEKCDHNVIPIKEIYEALQNELALKQIKDHYFFKGIIKYYGCKYPMNKDYIFKDTAINMPYVFNEFIKSKGEITYEEIKDKFPSFNYSNISLLLPQCSDIISIGNTTLMHASKLKITADDYHNIKEFIKKKCATFPISSRRMFSLFEEHFLNFLLVNEIDKHAKLFGILKYMFKKEFVFSRPYISLEKFGVITNRNALLHYLEDIDSASLEHMLSICVDNGIRYHSIAGLVEAVRPDFIRIDGQNFMRSKKLNVTDEVVQKVTVIIKEMIDKNNGYLAAKNFKNYKMLPKINIKWNDFLLESVVALSDNSIRILRISTTSTENSAAIFVNETHNEREINPFILKLLINEHKKKPFVSVDNILNWLKKEGLCNIKLPEFLISENHLIYDKNGNLKIK